MKTLVIYDESGYVIQSIKGDYRVPIGIPYLEVEIPEGKYLQTGIGVDLSTTPHQAIIVNAPKSETDLITERLEATEQMLLQMMLEGVK